ATLALPADCTWSQVDGPATVPAPPPRACAGQDAIDDCAAALRGGEPAMILMTGQALLEQGLQIAAAIAAATGARLACDTFNARIQRGAGRARIDRVPYFPEQALEMLAGVRHLVLVGTRAPVAFFGYPDTPGVFAPPDCSLHTLVTPAEDALDALARLAEQLSAPAAGAVLEPAHTHTPPADARLDPEVMGMVIGALLPEGAIVVEEAITGGLGLLPYTAGAAPHDWLSHTGGAIGQGLPLATGAALACPDRKVLCLEGDGSGMYSLQALWTQARERLDVVTVIYANRLYRILGVELQRLGIQQPGPRAGSLVDIAHPTLDWVSLARGMGVAAERVETVGELRRVLTGALRTRGPYLIEAIL
ncbi:MAG: acetolactate synthase large subunit, partial [Gammaproteobacteria bacterium]|nr:acetolactate synthase large subunit [Gammaproteobacteria bacterium]